MSSKYFQCRTCLRSCENEEEFIGLSSIDPIKKVSTQEKLETCVPEIVLENPNNTFLCSICWNALNTSYNFKCICLKTEKKMKNTSVPNSSELEVLKLEDFEKDFSLSNLDFLLDQSLNEESRKQLFQNTDLLLKTQEMLKKISTSDKYFSVFENNMEENRENNENGNLFECKRCFKNFFDKTRFESHSRRCGQYSHYCKCCGMGFYFKKTFIQHQSKCYFNSGIKNIPKFNRRSKRKDPLQKGSKIEIKNIVSKTALTPLNLGHQRMISVNKHFKRGTNLKLFNNTTKENKNNSIIVNSQKNKVKVNDSELNKTDKFPSENKLVQCSKCLAVIQKASMKMHLMRHDNIRLFSCSLCTKSFYKRYEVKIHMINVHFKDRSKSNKIKKQSNSK